MHKVFLKCAEEHDNVIDVAHCILPSHGCQHGVHRTLENCATVAHAKHHARTFEVAQDTGESSFVLVFLPYLDKIVACKCIESGPKCGATKLINRFLYSGYRIFVKNGYLIEFSVINAETPAAVGLAYEADRSVIR